MVEEVTLTIHLDSNRLSKVSHYFLLTRRLNTMKLVANLRLNGNHHRESQCGLFGKHFVVALLGCLFLCASAFAMPQDESARNSTKKLRVQPSPLASKIGTAVKWRSSYEEAIKESEASGKPIFWYVPTLRGTFMDRKTEIDRYMLAGPFSWPKIINLLNDHYIPVRSIPTLKQQQTFDLVPYKFVEPGFLVITSDQRVIQQADHLTTLHPQWLLQLFKQNTAGIAIAADEGVMPEMITQAAADSPLYQAWKIFSEEKNAKTGANLEEEFNLDIQSIADKDLKVEALLLRGMKQFQMGDHQQARETWKQAVQTNPSHPLAWKAAAEREGFGPFVRGFEVHSALPVKAYQAGVASIGSSAPNDTYPEIELWRRSTQYLLAQQRADGAFVDSDYDFGGTDSLPNVYVAVTALTGIALLDAQQRLPELSEPIQIAITKAAKFVSDDRNLNRIDRDEILWAQAFRLRFLCLLHSRSAVSLETVNRVTGQLEGVQSKRGNWYHEYNNSFVTATALVALNDASKAGGSVDMKKVDLGLQALLRDRYDNGAFPYYSVGPNGRKSEEEGSIPAAAGRMPICEMALGLWNKSDSTKLQFAVQQSLLFHDNLRVAYKYDNHTSTLAYGGFFFWYDMRSRAEAINRLPEGTQKTQAATKHHQLILALPELDGCFVDSHELGRCYGTSMALISLGYLDQVKK